MKRKQLRLQSNFQVVLGNEHSQAAEMVLAPGKPEGGAGNRHRGADQWLLVIAGTGQAKVNRRSYPLKAGTLFLIERGDEHEIQNTGREKLVTVNFYLPPAYTEELPAGRAS